MAHPKGLLMERLKKQGISPEFRTANTGPDHEPTFLTDVVVNGEVLGTGQGSNKREAERLAAEEALAFLDRNPLELEAKAPDEGSGAKKKSGPKQQEDSGRQTKAGKSGKQKEPVAKQAAQKEPPAKQAAPKGKAAQQPKRRSAEVDAAEEGRFEGPWPVFETLLAGIVEVAEERVDEDLKGEEARVAVRDFTLELYKDLLEDLGDVVEDEDEE